MPNNPYIARAFPLTTKEPVGLCVGRSSEFSPGEADFSTPNRTKLWKRFAQQELVPVCNRCPRLTACHLDRIQLAADHKTWAGVMAGKIRVPNQTADSGPDHETDSTTQVEPAGRRRISAA